MLKIVNEGFKKVLKNIKPFFYHYLYSYIFSSLGQKEGYLMSIMITKKFNIENEELKQFKNNENQNDDQFLSISSDLALQFALIIKNLLKNNDPIH